MSPLPLVGSRPASAPASEGEVADLGPRVLGVASATVGTGGHVFAAMLAEACLRSQHEVSALVEGQGAAKRLREVGVERVIVVEGQTLGELESSPGLRLVVGPTLCAAVRSRLFVLVGADRPLPAWRPEARGLRARRGVWLAEPRGSYAAGLAKLCCGWSAG